MPKKALKHNSLRVLLGPLGGLSLLCSNTSIRNSEMIQSAQASTTKFYYGVKIHVNDNMFLSFSILTRSSSSQKCQYKEETQS